jgi:hypothetical protein
VVDGITGVLYQHQTVASLTQAIKRFETIAETLDPLAIRSNAEQFSVQNFKSRLSEFVDSKTQHITSSNLVDI